MSFILGAVGAAVVVAAVVGMAAETAVGGALGACVPGGVP